MSEPISLTQQIAAPPTEVFRCFTNSTSLREWFCNTATLRPVPGGRIYLGWDHGYGVVGNFTELVPGERVGFTWVGTMDPGRSEVTVALAPAGKGTAVTLTHSTPAGEGWDQFRRGMSRTWDQSLENLASVVATGHDLRFTLRPMLGVMVDSEIDPERARKMGLPVERGVVLSGTAEGMGARTAGLTGGDVVVKIGETPVTGFPSFAVALQPHRAGDTVEVVYYRDATEQRAQMTLSGRPIPEVPGTAAELARFVAKEQEWVDAELAAAFAGATDTQAAAKPGPEEWSAKEVLAHLLDGEGDYHSYIAELIQGAERSIDGPFDNSDIRTGITADAYPTVAAMLAAYRHLEEQTVALLAALPKEFVARKGSFWRLAYGYTQGRQHYEDHFAQIRAAIAAAT